MTCFYFGNTLNDTIHVSGFFSLRISCWVIFRHFANSSLLCEALLSIAKPTKYILIDMPSSRKRLTRQLAVILIKLCAFLRLGQTVRPIHRDELNELTKHFCICQTQVFTCFRGIPNKLIYFQQNCVMQTVQFCPLF